jgi:hypothetical protein
VLADPDADLEGALGDWRRFRRRKRLVDVHWVDAVYQAYLAALLSGFVVLLAASAVGDVAVSPAGLGEVEADGAAWVGVVAAALLGVGLRSGSRGGPLALERAEVRHVLLSPVDRVYALRAPALRQLRFATFVAASAGAAAGALADRRLPGTGPAWAACGALFGVGAVALAYGAACVAAGVRLRPWLAAVLAIALVAWSVGDATGELPVAPLSALGHVALWPVTFEVAGLVPLLVAVVTVVVGLRLIAGLSLEALERRSSLVGELRFAATLQDLRTVVVLRRQLAQERPRGRPWLRPPLPPRFPVLVRDVRGVLRWPAGRFARLLLLGAVAGLAARGAWDGTTPLLVVTALALFLAGLDATEPIGQELDHPSRRDSVPVPAGWLYVRHLPTAVLIALVPAAAGAVLAVAVDPVRGASGVAALMVVPAALGAVAGAAVNQLMGDAGPAVSVGSGSSAWDLAPPEAAGMRLLFRMAWPPVVCALTVAPLIAGRAAAEDGRGALEAIAALLPPVVLLVTLVGGWVRFREDIKAWFRAQQEQAGLARTATSPAAPDGDASDHDDIDGDPVEEDTRAPS